MARFRTTCRVIAGFYLVIVLFAVLWDSGAQIAMLKESLGPWFLDAVGKDIVLNPDDARLSGLPEAIKPLLADLARQRDMDGYCLTLDAPVVIPVLTYADCGA